MMPDDMEQKRNHTFYITNEASQIVDDLAEVWGIPRSAVLEMSVRAVWASRSALTYEIARQAAEDQGEDREHP